MSIDKSAISAELDAAMSGEPTEPTETPPAKEEAAPENAKQVQYFDFPWEGKTLKIPMNYKIPLKENGEMQEWEFGNLLNKARSAANLERKYTETSSKLKEYGDYDAFLAQKQKYDALQTWSEQNPKDWERLFDMFQNREKYTLANGEQAGQNQQLLETITSLRKEIDELKGNFGKYDELYKSQENEKIVNAVLSERAEFEKAYPFFDLNEKDVDGVDRFSAIIHFGSSNGYPDFKSAAMAMFGDQIVKAATELGRKSLTDQMKKDKANGVIARTSLPNGQSTPTTGRPATDRKAVAAQELELALSKLS